MIKNYVMIAFRNIFRHKSYSIINIFGLSIGMICFILIGLWIIDELSVDRFNEHFQQIYRIGTSSKIGEVEGTGTSTSVPLATALMQEIPEIEKAVRLKGKYENLVSYEDKSFLIDEIYYTDPEIFDIFSIQVIDGSNINLLSKPKTVVINQSTASRFFPHEDPIGKTIVFDNKTEYEIVAVTKDFPADSHWSFKILASFCSLKSYNDTNWLSNNLITYIRASETVTAELLAEKINALFVTKADPLFQQMLGTTIKEWEKTGNYYHLRLTPLSQIYLYSSSDNALGKKGDIRYVYLFAGIGFFILLIASINFMNITTARSSIRAKEIGIRKLLGSSHNQLIRQFLMESIWISIIAMILALLFARLFLPYFNNFTGKELSIGFMGVTSYILYFAIAILIGLLSGAYSAVKLSSLNIISATKGNIINGNHKGGFRNALVLFQFSISIIVILCAIISTSQMKYISNKKLGFDKEHLLVIDRAYILRDQLSLFKDEVIKSPAVASASAAYSIPGSSTDGSMFNKDNNTPEELYHFYRLCGDADYIETMGFKLTQGRNFFENTSDKRSIIVNEAAIKKLGYTDPIGRNLKEPGSDEDLTIIGVIKDFHYNSLMEEISPVMIFHDDVWFKEFLVIRIHPENISETLDYIKLKWEDFAGNQPFEYFFMDTYFDNLHKSEKRSGQFFLSFAVLAIFIACLGLFGLVTFSLQQKTREIGIRKIHGASSTSITLLLIMQFMKWVLWGNLIAWPAGYFLMSRWLDNYAYRIYLSPLYFIIAGSIALIIALITVSYLTITAAGRNPVDTLKYE